MNIDIENINTIEKIHKVRTKWWRTIYEVIQQDIFEETDTFPDDFIKHCKKNANEAQNIPLEVKNNMKQMSKEQGFDAKVVMLRQKYLKITESNKSKNEAKFKFQGQSARSQRWFDLDFDWI